jgi:CRISP-associated protein Cas1
MQKKQEPAGGINQADILKARGHDVMPLLRWSEAVRSGDPDNIEARAAAWFWPKIFAQTALEWVSDEDPEGCLIEGFLRDRFGDWPNCLLNYGYAILRAVIARSLVGSGLLPSVGIHHRNQYNAYCLADDIMEPYRPYVDRLVCDILREYPEAPAPNKNGDVLNPSLKRALLVIPVMDVQIEGKQHPLQIAAQRTTNSLVACYEGTMRQILYPVIIS